MIRENTVCLIEPALSPCTRTVSSSSPSFWNFWILNASCFRFQTFQLPCSTSYILINALEIPLIWTISNFIQTFYEQPMFFFLTEKRATGGILITGKLVTETTFLPPDNKIWKKKSLHVPSKSEVKRKEKNLSMTVLFQELWLQLKFVVFKGRRPPKLYLVPQSESRLVAWAMCFINCFSHPA